MKWNAYDVLDATGGRVYQADENRSLDRFVIKSIETDSRKLKPNSLFIAIKGERFDGHDFVLDAINKGSRVIIFDSLDKIRSLIKNNPGVLFIEVEDTRKALGNLALHRRQRFSGPVIAVTGSNGKTSTKEMVALVLSSKFRVFKTPQNWNNDIGVPLSIFQIDDFHDIAVLELGINHPGEMKELVRISLPDIGIITNIQPAHLEGLKSEESVFREKTTLWNMLPESGTIIANADDPRLFEYAKNSNKKVITFGTSDYAHVQVENISINLQGTEFTVRCNDQTFRALFPGYGVHHVLNAAASIACGICFDIHPDDALKQLTNWVPVVHRMQKIDLIDGTIIFDDCYNANPVSMGKAIETVSYLATKYNRTFIAVLGDMRELGERSELFHREIGEKLAKANPYAAASLGKLGAAILEEVRKRHSNIPLLAAEKPDEVVEWLQKNWQEGSLMLFKASRAIALENVIEPIVSWKGRAVE